MRRILTFILLSYAFLSVTGQPSATVSGRVMEKLTGESLPFATIILIGENNRDTITGVLSDLAGRFILAGIEKGNYLLTFSFVGFTTKSLPLLVGELNNRYDMGRIERHSTWQIIPPLPGDLSWMP